MAKQRSILRSGANLWAKALSLSKLKANLKKKKIKNKATESGTHNISAYLLFSLIDPQKKHKLGQKHSRRRVWMDAPGVGLESSEAGEHQDSEEESQHRKAQCGVCDEGQRLQISFQLLLIEGCAEWMKS